MTKAVLPARGRSLHGLPRLSGGILGEGFFNEVWAISDEVVAKVARPYGRWGQPLRWLERNRREHELAARFTRIPSTYHVRVRDEHGVPANVILQKRLHGVLLHQLPDRQLYEGGLAAEVAGMVRDMDACARSLGWLPDVIGGPPRWGMHDVRRSNNYMLDRDGRLWLIDPSSLFFWFSRRNPVGRLYTGLLLATAHRLARRARGAKAKGERRK